MKKILFLLLFISFSGYAQDNVFYKNFKSDILNSERTLKIFLPKSYETETDRTYPIAIVFDAEYLFDIYVANSKLFALRDKAPEQIVIGVFQNQNKERYTDCGYDRNTGFPDEVSSKFYGFIKNELLQYVDMNYRTSVFRTVVGNTITANFTNYFLLEDYSIFNAYININPSYAPRMDKKLQATREVENDLFYYVCGGEFNPPKRRNSINEVNAILQKNTNDRFKYKYNDFSFTTKTASIGQAIPSAMGHVFSLFAAISKKEFDEEISLLTPLEAIKYLEKKYIEIDYLYSSNLKIRETDIYKIEPIIIDKENGDYLEEFGKMILRLYPESPTGDYYIGLYYETGYDYKRALKHYKNGYAKIHNDNDNADAYYSNIERILEKRAAEKSTNFTEEELNEDENIDEENKN